MCVLGVESPGAGRDSIKSLYLQENAALPGPYRRPMSRVLGGSYGGKRFLMSEVPMYTHTDWSLEHPHSHVCQNTKFHVCERECA